MAAQRAARRRRRAIDPWKTEKYEPDWSEAVVGGAMLSAVLTDSRLAPKNSKHNDSSDEADFVPKNHKKESWERAEMKEKRQPKPRKQWSQPVSKPRKKKATTTAEPAVAEQPIPTGEQEQFMATEVTVAIEQIDEAVTHQTTEPSPVEEQQPDTTIATITVTTEQEAADNIEPMTAEEVFIDAPDAMDVESKSNEISETVKQSPSRVAVSALLNNDEVGQLTAAPSLDSIATYEDENSVSSPQAMDVEKVSAFHTPSQPLPSIANLLQPDSISIPTLNSRLSTSETATRITPPSTLPSIEQLSLPPLTTTPTTELTSPPLSPESEPDNA